VCVGFAARQHKIQLLFLSSCLIFVMINYSYNMKNQEWALLDSPPVHSCFFSCFTGLWRVKKLSRRQAPRATY
jgi:hypothetical protein